MAKKKKVLIVVENLPVPFDTRVWKECRALSEAGYKVFVICPRGRGYGAWHETVDNVCIYRHPMPSEGRGALGYIIEYTSALFWEFILSWWIFIRHGFDIVQGCNPPDTIFLVAAPFKLFGVKYVFDHHDVCPELYRAKFGKQGSVYKTQLVLEKLTFKTADVVMSTNETYRNIALSRGGLSPEDVFVVRNGPDIESFRVMPPKQSLMKGAKYLVGYVGTMAVQEGLDTLLEVARWIREQGRADVHFVLVGGGPELSTLKSMCLDMGLGETVDFLGRVPDETLIEALSTADVCVNPDRVNEMNDMSTMIKVMEYMALGKAIVQFDLKEGRYSAGEASLYAENTVEDFAGKILWLLDHPDERRQMGEHGQRRIREQLAWQHSIPRLLAAYARASDKA